MAIEEPVPGGIPPVAGEIRVPLREIALAAGLYAALLALVFWNVLFAGRSLVYTDNYNPFDDRPIAENYGPGAAPASDWGSRDLNLYPNFHDPGATWWQWEAAGAFLRGCLDRGEWPFWDPFVGGGAPSFANLTPAYLFPPSLVAVLAGNGSGARNALALFMLFQAGLFTFVLLRKHGLGRTASLFGGAAWMLSGALVTNAASFIGQPLACAPLALVVLRRLLDRPTGRRTALLALVWGGIALASFPPNLIAVFGVATLYAAAMLLDDPDGRPARERLSIALRVAAGGALGVALVAPAYLPAFAAMREAPQIRTIYDHAGSETLRPANAIQLFSPFLLETERIWMRPATSIRLPYSLPSIGLAVAALALFARRRGGGRRGPLVSFAALAALLVAAKLFGLPPLQWFSWLPGLRTVHFAVYFGGILTFLLVLLAAAGVETILVDRKRGAARAWPALVLLAGVLSAGWLIARAGGTFTHPNVDRWLFHFRWLAAAAAVVVVSIALAFRAEAGSRRRLAALSLALGVFVAEAFASSSWPRQFRWDVWRRPPPYVRELAARAGLERVFASATLPANDNSPFGIVGLDSLMTFNAARSFRFYVRWFSPGQQIFLRGATNFPPDGVLDAASVGSGVFAATKSGLVAEAVRRDWKKILEDGRNVLFRRPDPLPRYVFTSAYRVVDGDDALDAVAERTDRRELLVEHLPPFPPAPNSPDDPEVVVLSFGLDRVALRVNAPRPGFVSCSESWFPGWSARVDGRPAPIARANYAFRAVAVPAGEHVVELSYFPEGLVEGLVLAGLALAAIAALVLRREPAPLPAAA